VQPRHGLPDRAPRLYVLVLTVGVNVGGIHDCSRSTECVLAGSSAPVSSCSLLASTTAAATRAAAARRFLGAYVLVLMVGFNVGGSYDCSRSAKSVCKFFGAYVLVLTVGFIVGGDDGCSRSTAFVNEFLGAYARASSLAPISSRPRLSGRTARAPARRRRGHP